VPPIGDRQGRGASVAEGRGISHISGSLAGSPYRLVCGGRLIRSTAPNPDF
jgi:hypothetical protein